MPLTFKEIYYLIETFESMASNVDKSIHNNTKEIDKLRTLKQTYLQKFFG